MNQEIVTNTSSQPDFGAPVPVQGRAMDAELEFGEHAELELVMTK
jgi:hypothetical protein